MWHATWKVMYDITWAHRLKAKKQTLQSLQQRGLRAFLYAPIELYIFTNFTPVFIHRHRKIIIVSVGSQKNKVSSIKKGMAQKTKQERNRFQSGRSTSVLFALLTCSVEGATGSIFNINVTLCFFYFILNCVTSAITTISESFTPVCSGQMAPSACFEA